MADQPIRTATGQPYGAAKAQADLQRAAPLPGPQEMPVMPLNAPTMRPAEHVMAGANAGPGPSAAEAGVIGADGDPEQVLNILRGLYSKYPLPGIEAAIMDYAKNPPWSFDDLKIDLADQATIAAQKAERNRRFDELAGIGRSRMPRPPSPARARPPRVSDMFDPSAQLDPSQVDDQRAPTGAVAAAAAGLGMGAAASGPPTITDEGDTNTTADMFTDDPKLRMKGPR